LFSSIERNQAEVVSNDLIYHNGEYAIDFEDFEYKASDPKVKLFILCSPHTPLAVFGLELSLNVSVKSVCGTRFSHFG
jgi:bifunctional pyridoxal-dependent enzyme with beta-cystathionase and maltose regulon repressor activities